jgi:hypothetical protein
MPQRLSLSLLLRTRRILRRGSQRMSLPLWRWRRTTDSAELRLLGVPTRLLRRMHLREVIASVDRTVAEPENSTHELGLVLGQSRMHLSVPHSDQCKFALAVSSKRLDRGFGQ